MVINTLGTGECTDGTACLPPGHLKHGPFLHLKILPWAFSSREGTFRVYSDLRISYVNGGSAWSTEKMSYVKCSVTNWVS